MKKEKNMLLAFLLNFSFSILEFLGGLFTNSIAIVSDSVHDLGDALSIGVAFFLEKKSKKEPDQNYTYGYARYSALGAIITSSILLAGSILVIYNSIRRIFSPVEISYDGMIVFAIFGFVMNFLAMYITKDGHSLNEKVVNLHMLEDVFGWVLVLIGAVVMRFTDLIVIDPILSIIVSAYIFTHVIKYFKEVIDLFLEKTPKNISIKEIEKQILNIKNVVGIHHIHIWSIDGNNNYATMHLVISKNDKCVKDAVRNELKTFGISHVTIEIEMPNEKCDSKECCIEKTEGKHHHH